MPTDWQTSCPAAPATAAAAAAAAVKLQSICEQVLRARPTM